MDAVKLDDAVSRETPTPANSSAASVPAAIIENETAHLHAYCEQVAQVHRGGTIADPRSWERALIELGLSRGQAKKFMAQGYRGIASMDHEDLAEQHCESNNMEKQQLQLLTALLEALRS